MFHRLYLFSALVHVFPRRLVTNKLLTCDRVLAFRETVEVLLAHFALEAPLLGEPSVPLAEYLIALRIVVVARVRELFGVIRLRLTRAQGIRYGQHGLAYSKKYSCLDSVRIRWWSRVCFTSFGTSFCSNVPSSSAVAATACGGSSVRICAGRSMYFGCWPGNSMNGKFIRTTRFPFLRYPHRLASPLISEAMTSGSTWRSKL